MKKSNVVLGVLAGAAIGALVGILFAPDKGTNTRKKLRRKGEDAVSYTHLTLPTSDLV